MITQYDSPMWPPDALCLLWRHPTERKNSRQPDKVHRFQHLIYLKNPCTENGYTGPLSSPHFNLTLKSMAAIPSGYKHFHVLRFHVVPFYASLVGPSSRPTFLRPAFWAPPLARVRGIMLFGCPSGCPSVNTHFGWRDVSEPGRISTKLGTNIHHSSRHCWKDFQGHRSKIKVIIRPVNPSMA